MIKYLKPGVDVTDVVCRIPYKNNVLRFRGFARSKCKTATDGGVSRCSRVKTTVVCPTLIYPPRVLSLTISTWVIIIKFQYLFFSNIITNRFR